MSPNWREMVEELLRDLGDAQREIKNLEIVFLASDGATVKAVEPREPGASAYLEVYELDEILDELLERWRRKTLVAQIEDDRERVAR